MWNSFAKNTCKSLPWHDSGYIMKKIRRSNAIIFVLDLVFIQRWALLIHNPNFLFCTIRRAGTSEFSEQNSDTLRTVHCTLHTAVSAPASTTNVIPGDFVCTMRKMLFLDIPLKLKPNKNITNSNIQKNPKIFRNKEKTKLPLRQYIFKEGRRGSHMPKECTN